MYRSELLRQEPLLRKILQVLFLLSLELVRVGKDALQGAKLFQQFNGCLFADSRNPRNVIYSISHKPEDIPHQVNVSNVPFFTNLLGAHHIHAISHEGRFVKKNVLVYKLSIVLVGGHHVHRKPFFFCFFGKGAYQIIRLKSIQLQTRDTKGLDKFFYPRNGHRDVLRLCLSVGLVGLVLYVAKSRGFGVKNDRNMTGLFFLQYFQKRVGEA